MENIKRLLLSLITAISLFLITSSQPASAASNFTTDYHMVYTAAESGNTHALLNITLTNTTTQYYASSYKVQLGFDTINNLRINDPDGPIKPVLTKNADGHLIDVTFNKKSVGKGSKLPFTIEFDTPNITRRYGKIWEIAIPGIANPDDFTSFMVEVRTPPSFGKPIYSKPKLANNTLIFTKEQLRKSGIAIAFGQKQAYTFHLTYHLKNTNLYPSKTEIALPPSTNYQKVFITGISPQPDNVIEDKDGNWLAQYNLSSAQKLDVVVDGKAEVNLTPAEQPISVEDRQAYLADQPYWQVNNDKIRELADELVTVENIYAYVIQTLTYDYANVKDERSRMGALETLKKPKAASSHEFTDLFIAIARAAKIPAREVQGFAYTENTKQRPVSDNRDVLHSWPEYYDDQKKTWVMVDPTWGSTTGGIDYFSVLDFNHLAFVIRGRDSSHPIPAGGYKLQHGKITKDVQVTFADTLPADEQTAELSTSIPKIVNAGWPISGEITVKNTSPSRFTRQLLYVNSKTLSPHDQTFTSPNIPPFGTAKIPLRFNPPFFLTNSQETFTIRVAEKTVTQTITVAPFFMTRNGGGILIGLFAIIVLIIALKSRRLRVSRHK